MRSLAFVFGCVMCAGAAYGDGLGESARYAGAYVLNYETGGADFGDGIVRSSTVYSNRSSAANFGVSSTDLTSNWGDRAFTTGTGLLEQFSFTLFNSTNGGQNTNPLTSATVAIQFNRMSDSSLIGAFNVNTGAINLNPGFYVVLTVSNLQSLGILVNDTDILVQQTTSNIVGGTNRIGIASLNPVTIGSSPDSMYVRSGTIGGGVPGFYTFSGPAQVGYEIVVPTPASVAVLGLAGLVATRRRR